MKRVIRNAIYLVALCFVSFNIAAQGTIDLNFSSQIDCDNNTLCTTIQLQAQDATSFQIGTSSMLINYNASALQFASYTSSTFNGSDLCIGGVASAWSEHTFDAVSVAGSFNLTLTLSDVNRQFSCPTVDNSAWIDVGVICFNILDDTQQANLSFDVTNTNFNSHEPNDGSNPVTKGTFGIDDGVLACVPVGELDVLLEKTVDMATANIGQQVVYTLTLTNQSGTDLTSIDVADVLPLTVSYTAGDYTASQGTFDGSTWTVGALANTEVATLDITVTVNAEGVHLNMANISTINGEDVSTSTNAGFYATACTSTPVEICDGDGITATAPEGYTTYTWYKDGVEIAGATTNVYNITEPGSYVFVVDDAVLGSCGDQLCCPIIVIAGECNPCPPTQCIPITVTRVN